MLLLTVLSLLSFQSSNDALRIRSVTLENAEAMRSFYEALDSLVQNDDHTLSIVHIGDSHIQADYLTGTMRKNFQRLFGNAGRGFVFPYRLVRSSGARDVRITASGNWSYETIMRNDPNSVIGASGYVAHALEPCTLTIDVGTKAISNASFNTLRLLDLSDSAFTPQVNEHYALRNDDLATIEFDRFYDSLSLSLNDSGTDIRGFVLENGQPGILYHAMGVNGSSTLQYLRSRDFEEEIAKLNAQLVVISFGTNDCYVPRSRFCSSCIVDRYREMIRRIRVANPNVSILLTIPPDHYYYRRYPNRNVSDLQKALLKMAEKEDVAVYDLYTAMGGYSSIYAWYREQLARRDLIHFTQRGYEKQGEMIFESVMHHYQER